MKITNIEETLENYVETGPANAQDMNSAPPQETVATTQAEYAIDRIVGHRNKTTGREYRVGWYGYKAEQDT